MKKNLTLILFSAFISLATTTTFAKTQEKSIHFIKGTDHSKIAGSFTGYDDIHYKVYAKKGQTLKFNLESNQGLAYLNIFAPEDQPGKANALLIGSSAGSVGEIVLPTTGAYTLQVYQMRNSARQNKTVKFNLALKIPK